MKALTTLAALVVALVLSVSACGTDPVGSHGDGSVVTADAGPTGSDIATGTDGSKADADASSQPDNSVDADSGGTQGDEVGQDGTADAVPLCPPAGKPSATLEMMCADGPCCVVPGDEEQMVKDIVNAKFDPGGYGFPQANMMPAVPPNPTGGGGCATIHMPDYCFPVVKIVGQGYKPSWADQLGPYEGDVFLTIKFPDSSNPDGVLAIAIIKCEGGICLMEMPVSLKPSQWKATYNITEKKLSLTYTSKGEVQFVDEFKLE